ncbi:hypothetical protein BC567DRAFT_222786, partial [Phyllosticta citribraziliensis]
MRDPGPSASRTLLLSSSSPSAAWSTRTQPYSSSSCAWGRTSFLPISSRTSWRSSTAELAPATEPARTTEARSSPCKLVSRRASATSRRNTSPKTTVPSRSSSTNALPRRAGKSPLNRRKPTPPCVKTTLSVFRRMVMVRVPPRRKCKCEREEIPGALGPIAPRRNMKKEFRLNGV